MQLTANALCLLGEVYMSLGADESSQMFQASITTAYKMNDYVSQSAAIESLVKLARKAGDSEAEVNAP